MPSKPTNPPRCRTHNRSIPCPQCRRVIEELPHVGAWTSSASQTTTNPADYPSFVRDNPEALRSGHGSIRTRDPLPTHRTSSLVQQSTRQPPTNKKTYPTQTSTMTRTTRLDSPIAQRPVLNAGHTLPIRPAPVSIQGSAHTKTPQPTANSSKARMLQNQASAVRRPEAEEEEESSSEEESEEDDDEESEDEDKDDDDDDE